MAYEDYEVVIGLEIHAELKTKTKVFCSCENRFGDQPNTNVCPVCLGLPGALPVINKRAVELAIKAGLTFGCDINDVAIFERKNYFYPDLSKAYQISQLQKPLCLNGSITLDSGKVVRLNRIHLEEDAGKLVHVNEKVGTLVDYNRGGVPLIETVTEPDINSAEEAVEFLTKLRSNLTFGDIADCRMEQGGMRCDVNLSVHKKGTPFGTRTEMKNLNSFKMVYRAIKYEADRQIEILEQGGTITQQTRKWDDNKGKSFTMRSKEEAQDYRYFPDPDILPITVSREVVEHIRQELPKLAPQRLEEYVQVLGLPEYDAKILTQEKTTADYFEQCLSLFDSAKIVSNWIMTDVLRKLKEVEGDQDVYQVISPESLVAIIKMVEKKEITRVNAKELFEQVCFSDQDPKALAKKLGYLSTMSDEELIKIIDQAIEQNPQALQDYLKEPEDIINYIIGQTMRLSRGTAKVDIARPIIKVKLDELTKK